MSVSEAHFEYVRGLARDMAAIVLDPGKEYLVESRLSPLAKQEGFNDLAAFLEHMQKSVGSNGLHDKIIDALTTNETSFFRDLSPFDALRQTIIPGLIEKRAHLKRLSFWSAASSTGQEAYTLSMILKEYFPVLADWEVKIHATDLSPTVLAQAKEGRYNQLEVNRGLPAIFLIKYFTKVGNDWVLKEDIRKMVAFEQMNLVKTWPTLPIFDVIFLRNVMIYFDTETKKKILANICKQLHPEGYFFLGTAETTMNLNDTLRSGQINGATVYRKTGAA